MPFLLFVGLAQTTIENAYSMCSVARATHKKFISGMTLAVNICFSEFPPGIPSDASRRRKLLHTCLPFVLPSLELIL